jgi:hypothetical protein
LLPTPPAAAPAGQLRPRSRALWCPVSRFAPAGGQRRAACRGPHGLARTTLGHLLHVALHLPSVQHGTRSSARLHGQPLIKLPQLAEFRRPVRLVGRETASPGDSCHAVVTPPPRRPEPGPPPLPSPHGLGLA